MTEREIEVVAEALTKVGDTTRPRGREHGQILRVVSGRYRERERGAIAALECLRAIDSGLAEIPESSGDPTSGEYHSLTADYVRVGAVVVYRSLSDKRAITCMVKNQEERWVYLLPYAQPDVGCVPLDVCYR